MNDLVAKFALIIQFVLAQANGGKLPQETITWKNSLPLDVQASVLWSADHEKGSLVDWEYDRNPDNNGGGIFTTGNKNEAIAIVDQLQPFTGKFCVKTTIHNAIESRNGGKAVRLLRWTDRPWDQGGRFFPKTAYYSVWMRLERKYSTRNPTKASSGWWNVFQFKSEDENGVSQPVWVLNIGDDPQSGKMYFYLYSDYNRPASISQQTPVPIPIGRWFHVEALYEQSSAKLPDGSLSVWQDGQLILSANHVTTVLAKKTIWGVGNYADHITGGKQAGTATLFFDDATISTKPTHLYVDKMLKVRK